MAIEIKHLFESNVPDGEDDNLVQPSDWNANHVLSGGGTLRIPQLIESKTLSGSNAFTFSNLNGDVDEEYLLVADLEVTSSGAEVQIRCYPNNDTGANYSNIVSRYAGGWSTTGNWDSPYCILWFMGATANGKMLGTTRILAKTGSKRAFVSESHTPNTLGWLDFFWTNTASNITSLVCTVTNGTVTGKVKLYKMVDLVLGGS